ncbi:glutaminyl-peptide cyclotransferase [Amycolatopsis keratiniphila]|uniref:glutaminyl-peptide cyclotransferase n=1 Tax=Amycolatopsis keratiniphila TaxID=129921 RepID=UPI000907ABCF|nr:glutaminyl-peptide cyclotransferase [Amycolatopsis keratiniphila]OLZ52047.1 glutaminyl-peptide cyclotransferase [Amycolatopsis keratiniphila subsp. nogabecina]
MRTLMTTSLLLAAVLGGCAAAPVSDAAPPAPEKLKVRVLSTLPHDPAAFTQGLEFSGETLYEGTGLVGKSSMRAGPAGAAPTVRQELPGLFGEGITVLGATAWQITWQDGVAIERDAKTLAELRRVTYTGEGWGLCHQAGRLVMSDGSSKLTFRDPVSFAPTGSVDVGRDQLNELECVGDSVYANVWQTDRILRIDAATGRVTGEIDASGLLDGAERGSADVLNGIAAVPGTDEFLITGKLWPRMFRVKFVPIP